MKKLISFLMVLALLIGFLQPLAVEAAEAETGWYVTTKSTAVWSKPASSSSDKSSKKLEVLPSDTFIEVTQVKTNAKGNIFLKINEGWIFFGNVQPHTHSVCSFGEECTTIISVDDLKHQKAVTRPLLCQCGEMIDYELQVYHEEHSFVGNSCTTCKYERHVCQGSLCGPIETVYEQLGNGNHRKVQKSHGMCACGKVVQTDMYYQETTEVCDYENGTCSFCGSEGEHQHHFTTSIRYEDTYYANTATQITEATCECGSSHVLGRKLITRDEAVEKGALVETFFQNTYTEHTLTYAFEKVCTVCKENYSDLAYADNTPTYNKCICKSLGGYVGGYIYEVEASEPHEYVSIGNGHIMCVGCGFDPVYYQENQELYANVLQTAMDICGFVPGIGDVADLASCLISLSRGAYGEAALNALCVLPLIGGVAGVFKVLDLVSVGTKTVTKVDDFIDLSKMVNQANDLPAGIGFKSFDQFKRAFGSAGSGFQWHHIVEQSQLQKSGFADELIHNTSNIIRVDTKTHSQITTYYKMAQNYTEGLPLREWLANQDFETNYRIGVEVLELFGVITK